MTQPDNQDLAFDGPTQAQDMGIVVQESWVQKHHTKLTAGLRFASHTMLIVSGAGLGGAAGSAFRVLTGTISSVAAGIMGLGPAAGFSERTTNKRSLETYLGSGVALTISGLLTNRLLESFSGVWCGIGVGLKRFAPDPKKPEPKPEGVSGKVSWYLRNRKDNPGNIGPDMLQLNAFIALLDGYMSKDYARGAGGLMLVVSNYLMLSIKKDKEPEPEEVGL